MCLIPMALSGETLSGAMLRWNRKTGVPSCFPHPASMSLKPSPRLNESATISTIQKYE